MYLLAISLALMKTPIASKYKKVNGNNREQSLNETTIALFRLN